jgi:hypothetical protein
MAAGIDHDRDPNSTRRGCDSVDVNALISNRVSDPRRQSSSAAAGMLAPSTRPRKVRPFALKRATIDNFTHDPGIVLHFLTT